MRKALAVLVVLGWALGMWYLWDGRDGACLRAYPQREVVGRMNRSSMGMFGSWVYTLSYPGTYEQSGEECWSDVRVTELEYDHLFDNLGVRYGRKAIGDQN